MPTFLPFNNNPTAVEIKTTSYTVPSTQYARVTVTNLETDFEIDSVIAVVATKHVGTTLSTTTIFTNTTPYALGGGVVDSAAAGAKTILVRHPSVGASTIASAIGSPYSASGPNNNYTTTAYSVDAPGVFVPMDCILAANTSSTYDFALAALTPPTDLVFWVPSSTDLDGSKYIVELFNNP